MVFGGPFGWFRLVRKFLWLSLKSLQLVKNRSFWGFLLLFWPVLSTFTVVLPCFPVKMTSKWLVLGPHNRDFSCFHMPDNRKWFKTCTMYGKMTLWDLLLTTSRGLLFGGFKCYRTLWGFRQNYFLELKNASKSLFSWYLKDLLGGSG